LALATLVTTVAAVSAVACSSQSTVPSDHPAAATTPVSATLADQLATARQATAAYVNDLDAAKRDGYQIITKMMPEMGFHYLKAGIEGFDVSKPPILVYLNSGSSWQLGAIEWVFPTAPSTPPLEGATYGSFAAACHYADGTFIPKKAQNDCPQWADGVSFTFWHPDLVTMHVRLWYHNPSGLYQGTNPLVQAYA